MKRRSFLAALFAAPIIPAVAKMSGNPEPFAVGKIRFSQEKNGSLSLNAANLGQVKTAKIMSDNGKLAFDLDAGTLFIRS